VRTGALMHEPEESFVVCPWRDRQEQDLADGRDFLHGRVRQGWLADRIRDDGLTQEEFIAAVLDRCSDNWLYVGYVLDEIKRSFGNWVSRYGWFLLCSGIIRGVAQRSGSAGRSAGKGRRVAARRDLEALRERRMRAARMFDRGARQVDVAQALGFSAQTASRWHRAWQEGGRAALAGTGRAGRPRKLSDAQVAQVEAALLKGPRAKGALLRWPRA
jgi:Homeodomain-like domain